MNGARILAAAALLILGLDFGDGVFDWWILGVLLFAAAVFQAAITFNGGWVAPKDLHLDDVDDAIDHDHTPTRKDS